MATLRALLIVCLALVPQLAYAQSAGFTFDGTSTGDNQLNAVTTQPTGGSYSTFTRTAVTWNAGANVFNSANWNASASINLNQYVGFSITPTAGNLSYLTQQAFGTQRSNTGPPNGEARLYGNVGSAPIATQSFTNPTSIANTNFNFDDVIAGETLAFRYYGWGATNTAGTLRFDNVLTVGATSNFVTPADAINLAGPTKIYADAAALTITNPIGGSGPLTKIGNQSVSLTGTNNYSGSTVVTEGTLLINGDSNGVTGSVTVATGANLGGTGNLGGSVNVSSGGTLRGDSGLNTGKLTSAGVAVANGGIVTAILGASGTSSQLDAGSGTFDLTTGARFAPTALSGFNNLVPATYTIASLSSGSNLTLDTAPVLDGFTFGTYVQGAGPSGPVVIDLVSINAALNAGDQFDLRRSGNLLQLTFTPVPEPTCVVAIAGAGLAGAAWLRRKRKMNAE